MIRLGVGLALAIAAFPALADTAPFQGDWTFGNPAACVLGRDDPNFAFRIEGDTLIGLESTCDLTNPTAIRDMNATLFDAQCVGEGEEWTYRLLLMIDIDGNLATIHHGSSLVYSRCTNSAPAGALK
ncbi:MAG: hypothetical protein R3D60_14130 [Paracoccaceae bacterium]